MSDSGPMKASASNKSLAVLQQNSEMKAVTTKKNEDSECRKDMGGDDPNKTVLIADTVVQSTTSEPAVSTDPNSTLCSEQVRDDDSNESAPASSIAKSNALPSIKKKELIRPLFSRSNTTDKANKTAGGKTMIVETETVDASNVPSVTLPIGGQTNNDIMTNTQTLANNLASLRSKKSTLFVDQPSQISSNAPNTSTNSVNQADDTDNVSVNGSIRHFNKRSNQVDSQLHSGVTVKPTTTKADFFAAKIANAVGDVSDSDSEETFVYESAPDALSTVSNTLPANKSMSSAALNNTITLRKINQRNVSMPVTSSNLHNFPPTSISNDDTSGLPHSSLQNNITSSIKEQSDNISVDSDGVSFHNNDRLPELEVDQQSLVSQPVHTESSKNGSPNSTIHIANHQKSQPSVQPATQFSSQLSQKPHYITKSSLEPTATKKVFTKYNGDERQRKVSNTSLIKPQAPANNHSHLRTTTSKLFDKKGGSLRRYSGVPDDVNIEDYIDQYDEENNVGIDDYSDTYDYDDYDDDDDDDDELTPLNVNIANSKLRSKMTNHYFNKRSFSNFRGTDSGENSQDYGSLNKDEGSFLNANKIKPAKRHKSRTQQRYQQTYSPHNFSNKKKFGKLQTLKNFMLISVFVFLMVSFGFIIGFLLATTKDLQDVTITSIEDVVATIDELVFDINVDAFNPGFIAIETNEIELDVFARSTYLKKDNINVPIFIEEKDSSTVQTILLGTVTELETSLRFEGGFLNRNNSTSKSTVKLLHPGENATDSDLDSNSESGNHKIENDTDKWRKIIKNPFDLIVRGRFIYHLPFARTERSISVTKTISVDPSSDEIIAHSI